MSPRPFIKAQSVHSEVLCCKNFYGIGSRAQNACVNVENSKREIESKIAFEVKNAFFAWPASASVLSGINLKIETGSLTVISGPAGSGKTSLILSLIDELKLESGSVDWLLDSRIALVTQKPW